MLQFFSCVPSRPHNLLAEVLAARPMKHRLTHICPSLNLHVVLIWVVLLTSRALFERRAESMAEFALAACGQVRATTTRTWCSRRWTTLSRRRRAADWRLETRDLRERVDTEADERWQTRGSFVSCIGQRLDQIQIGSQRSPLFVRPVSVLTDLMWPWAAPKQPSTNDKSWWLSYGIPFVSRWDFNVWAPQVVVALYNLLLSLSLAAAAAAATPPPLSSPQEPLQREW